MTTAKQVINSTKPNITKVPKGPTQKGSAGYDNIRDDIEKTKSLREGSIEKVPVNDNDISNKKYVDDEDAAADAHISADGSSHADVVTNSAKVTYDDAATVAANATHVAGDGSDHANVATNTTHISSDGTDHANVVLNDTHRADNSQAHSDYLVNNASDTTTGTLTAGAFTTGGQILGDSIGINCTPLAKLHVKKDAAGTIARFESIGNEFFGVRQDSVGDWRFYGYNTATPGFVSFGLGIDRIYIYEPSGNIGIGTITPAASAKLELSSTTGALLLTRMTTAQRDALSPSTGLTYFLYFFSLLEGAFL